MNKLTFTTKNCGTTFNTSSSEYNFVLYKPMLCPLCEAFQDGTVSERFLFQTNTVKVKIGVVSYRCTHCSGMYVVTYLVDKESKRADYCQMYPDNKQKFFDEEIIKVSPRFIDMYNQSLTAESNRNFDLAAMGYRASLEILVKDFAINTLKEERDTVISRSLCNAIGKYLESEELIKTADVVRILGNDAAHYMRKYPEHDFNILKKYMQIFIELVRVKLMILNPPVERK